MSLVLLCVRDMEFAAMVALQYSVLLRGLIDLLQLVVHRQPIASDLIFLFLLHATDFSYYNFLPSGRITCRVSDWRIFLLCSAHRVFLLGTFQVMTDETEL